MILCFLWLRLGKFTDPVTPCCNICEIAPSPLQNSSIYVPHKSAFPEGSARGTRQEIETGATNRPDIDKREEQS